MVFKSIKCPVCGQKVSLFWYYLSTPFNSNTCSNCKTRIKWHPIIMLYNLIFGIIFLSIFFILKNYITSQYIAIIIAFIPAYIIYLNIPKKVKIIGGKEKKKD